ncbi:MAG: hypothetical protein IJL22_01310 [Bacteroidales bacterium]|nr:hypothetical protein [Bacteroidales bacterium]
MKTKEYLPPAVQVLSMKTEGLVCTSDIILSTVATEEWDVVDLSTL